MTEVVAIVASGISIAQIAGQVTSSIIKIKNIWDQVKAAPEDISHLFREVDSFSLILQHIRDDLNQDALPDFVFDKECVRQSLDLCSSGAAELEILANDLAGRLERSSSLKRKIGSMKIVLKQDEMKRLKRRLKNAIRLLSLAYQCHTSAMVRLQPDIIVARLSSTMLSTNQGISEVDDLETQSSDRQQDETPKFTSHDLVAQHYNYWNSSPSWLELLIGSLDYQRRICRCRGRNCIKHQARYRFPQLFSQKVWGFETHRSLCDWSVNMRTYRIIPDDAPIFTAISHGDIHLVRNLLASKAAFVTDIDKWGGSLMHKATQHWRVEICQALIFQDADVCLPDFDNTPPLKYSSFFAPLAGNSNSVDAYQKTVRLLVDAGAHEDLVPETGGLVEFFGRAEVFEYLQQQTYPPYYEWPLKARFKVASTIEHYGPDAAYLMLRALTRTEIDREMVTYVDEYGNTFLHYLAWKFALSLRGRLARENEYVQNYTRSWRTLIKDVITAGASIYALNDMNDSILYVIIKATSWIDHDFKIWDVISSTSKILQLWLSDLQDLGIDLASYGAEELRFWSIIKHKSNSYLADDDLVIDIIGFSQGPRPEDWYLWYSEPTDIFAGEFWAMTETLECKNELELQIPGSWVECSLAP